MSGTQRGYRIRAWGTDPALEEMPRRSPGPGDVEVRVEACGVGLTVLNCINGNLARDDALLPRVPGHELAGRVVGVGPGVDETLVGRRVVAYFYRHCGMCAECSAGRQSRCRRLDGWIGVHSDGGYAPLHDPSSPQRHRCGRHPETPSPRRSCQMPSRHHCMSAVHALA